MSMLDKMIGDKKRWRQYRARVKAMPTSYRDAVDALQHYLMYFGPADGDSAATMFEDLADLFERAAADGTPIHEIVGDNPVEFIDAFAANYKSGGWVTREQQKLIDAIARAEAGEVEAQP
jgi:DNA-binding ferritin-like protein (Dps family)